MQPCNIKVLKIWTPRIVTVTDLKIEQFWVFSGVKHLKDADGMANSVDTSQTCSWRSMSGLGLHCLLRPICPNT